MTPNLFLPDFGDRVKADRSQAIFIIPARKMRLFVGHALAFDIVARHELLENLPHKAVLAAAPDSLLFDPGVAAGFVLGVGGGLDRVQHALVALRQLVPHDQRTSRSTMARMAHVDVMTPQKMISPFCFGVASRR